MAREALAPFESAIRAAFDRAWRLSQAEFETYKRWPHSRVRSNILQHRIVQEVEEVHPDLMRYARGRSLMILSGNVVAYFKKLDSTGRSSNIPTQLAMNFGQQQLNIPGIPPGVRVKVGYVATPGHSRLVDVMAVVADGESVLDMWAVKSEPVADIIDIVSASASAASAQPERKKARARKNSDAAKRRKASSGSNDDSDGNGSSK
jgi:hypothetical protein